MEEEFRAVLIASATVSAVAGGRIAWGAHAQGATGAYAVLSLVSGNQGHMMDGPDGLLSARVQVDCYGPTAAGAFALSRAITTAMDGYRGGGLRGVFHAGTRSGREGGSNEADRPFYVQLDFLTHWRN